MELAQRGLGEVEPNPAGDLNNDYVVNLSDLLMLLDCWPALSDLSVLKTLAAGWLTADRRYAAP